LSKRKRTSAAGARSSPGTQSRSTSAQRTRARARLINRALAGFLAIVVIAIVATAIAESGGGGGDAGAAALKEGSPAPPGSFNTLNGQTRTIASLAGQPTLVWFVTTWCSSCQAGTQAMASEIIGRLERAHVRVVELENAEDLGQEGPSMESFATHLAGEDIHNPDWTFGVASAALTKSYNPEGNLDVYYLLNAEGRIAYINSSPAATREALLAEAEKVSRA